MFLYQHNAIINSMLRKKTCPKKRAYVFINHLQSKYALDSF